MAYDHLREHPSPVSLNGTVPLQLLLNHGDGQSKPLTIDSLTQLTTQQLWAFSDICGIPYHLTNAGYASAIKNQLLDSASPLVGEGGMVNLQFTPKLSRQETSDISNMPIHINGLVVSHRDDIRVMCRSYGISIVIPKEQLLERFRAHLHEHPEIIRTYGAVDLVALANTKD
ncbi:hypothetical protein BASA50_004231 [Batrachochytrium salamandrivorans]|uniref:Uncharacterized protein n=1 Tax=Batrachochytrium salamandrivorans TaxID=1357716 RepID=A0ABQ8FJ85_9FUNG|nr:hypothetical protein BASA50_004231 [Batrachochytrium salamandrivorans]